MNEKFENVTVISKANVYYDGKVVSHTIFTPDGDRKTLGLFLPGDYEFGTADAEIMEIIDGVCQVRLRELQNISRSKRERHSTCPATASLVSAAMFRCSTYVPTFPSARLKDSIYRNRSKPLTGGASQCGLRLPL